MLIKEKPEWGDLATFIPNKRLPVYNWFYYKEGFARDLVFKLIGKFGLKKGGTVLDPCCGVGTTLLACRQKGLDSVGFDVQPAAVFASIVKTRDYDIKALEDAGKELLGVRFQKPELGGISPFTSKAFNRHTLDDVLFFRDSIMQIQDNHARDFLMLALINVTMKCSYAWKDGAVIKIRRHPVPPLRKMLKRQMKRMLRDLRGFETAGAKCEVDFGDARKMRLEDNSVDAIITSPPYLNKIEYSNIYSIEEELFFSGLGLTPLRSHIGINPEKVLSEKNKLDNITDVSGFNAQTIAYFNDMHKVIKEFHRVCRDGAKLGIVVGSGCFPDGVVDSDIILSRIAEHLGFIAKEIVVLNKRWCTRNRVEKVGRTRESLLIWEERV
jgi:DNA modification methylase